ncbi:MAG: patatin-like phospholipase family protein [Pseudomonadota bacterium]|jgi:NTE family protein|nr:patatin-like phospholipase family protein [Xanthomonadaceae bacterium]MDE2247556.1 patatin-like phospholipase family protein [Xanthomonadaceae bacterium]MDE3210200.1 patatin-like phospholipase family protein [Pseudomonadota bacterium]
MMHSSIPSAITIKLALEGGGAHGAFTWGVLDRLLELPGLRIEAISATSSGAMNAAALAQGWQQNGAAGAREALDTFWLKLSRQNAMADWWLAAAGMFDPGLWRKAPSAPLTSNPLRRLVEESFDIDLLRDGPIRLHLAATRVRDGALALFDNARLSHDALLASACLPQWFGAVEIDGEAYWDGGFAGNPVLEPLLGSGADDLLCVLLQPLQRSELPDTARDIAELAAQMSFTNAFKRELRDLARTRQRIGPHLVVSAEVKRLKRLRLHVITPSEGLTLREGHSAVDTRLPQLQALRDLGREAADSWWTAHGGDVGRRESFSLANWLNCVS